MSYALKAYSLFSLWEFKMYFTMLKIHNKIDFSLVYKNLLKSQAG